MTGISIDSNIMKLAVSMKAKPAQVRKGAIRGIDETAKYAVNKEKAILTSQSKSGSGRLFKSIDSIRTGEYGRAVGPMMNDKYPTYVEHGRGPIFPKLAGLGTGNHSSSYLGVHIGAVALKIPIGGKIIFRRSAKAAKARPFVKPTHSDLKIMYPRIMETEINKAMKR